MFNWLTLVLDKLSGVDVIYIDAAFSACNIIALRDTVCDML